MKLDRAFYESLRLEVQKREQSFTKKYRWLFVPVVGVALITWGIEPSIERLFDVTSRLLIPICVLFSVYLGIKSLHADKASKKILINLARENGGTYTENPSLFGEKAAMFSQGNSNEASQCVTFQGKDGGRFRLFRYYFSTGSGNSRKSFVYQVFTVSCVGIVPHMYLNYKANKYEMSLGQKLSLPSEFEKEFTLSIPEGYHIEALQIFTPDILYEILQLPFRCDIEFVNGEVLLFLENIHNVLKDFDKLEAQISGALKIVDMLQPKLNDLRWAPVGDKAYSL